MNQSPIVTRWRIYLQSFQHVIKKIKGKDNKVGDFLSRLTHLTTGQQIPTEYGHHNIEDDEDEIPALIDMSVNEPTPTEKAKPVRRELVPFPPWCRDCGEPRQPEYYIAMVHNTEMTHQGARKTWQALGRFFPGHRIPYTRVAAFVRDCPRCQKDARRMTKDIQPLTRTVIPPNNRFRIGIDLCTITPTDEENYKVCIVIVNLRTKLCSIYPAKDYTAQSVASVLMKYICTYGLVDEVVTDPGTHFLNEVVSIVNTWLGIRHIVSLVDVHESCGVEATNRECLQHLRALVNDKRLRHQWSKPEHIGLVEFALNDRVHSETGRTAFELTFGTADAKYFALPENDDSSAISNE